MSRSLLSVGNLILFTGLVGIAVPSTPVAWFYVLGVVGLVLNLVLLLYVPVLQLLGRVGVDDNIDFLGSWGQVAKESERVAPVIRRMRR